MRNIVDAWNPDSWQTKNNFQQIHYLSATLLHDIQAQLSQLSPLILPQEIIQFSAEMEKVAKGNTFLFQAGDCTETFENCDKNYINAQLSLIEKASTLLEKGLGKKICRVGRIAGQYAKPRSEAVETKNMQTLPSYYGDIINSSVFSSPERIPDPKRMLAAYMYANKTLEYVRAWNKQHHEKIFVSHEALFLPYEQALTRSYGKEWYNLSCHFPWIGMRTTHPKSAHIEYVRGILNPIAIKLGAHVTLEEVLSLIALLNPFNIAGRLTLIYRLGVDHIHKKLPQLLEEVLKERKAVLWVCDPMHGNTKMHSSGVKIRYLDDISQEISSAIQIHKKYGIDLNGLHLEATAEDIKECVGSANETGRKYKSKIDPRLNFEQTLEIIKIFTQEYRNNTISHSTRIAEEIMEM